MSSHVYYYMSILQFILEVKITWNTSYSQWKCCTHLKQRLWTQVIQTPFRSSQEFFFFFLSCSTFRANSPSESMWIAMNSSSWLLCVSGCISGRGQAEGEGGRPDRALVQQMEEAYSSLSVRLPEANPEVQRLYEDWLEGEDSPCVQQTLHTHYNNHTQSPSNTPGPDIQWWSRSEKGPVYFCTSEQSFTAGKQKDPSKDQDVAMKDFLL